MIRSLDCGMWMDVLAYLAISPGVCISGIASALGGSYAHVYNVCGLLYAKGLVDVVKEGRKDVVSLSPRGRSVAGYVVDIQKILVEG